MCDLRYTLLRSHLRLFLLSILADLVFGFRGMGSPSQYSDDEYPSQKSIFE